MTTRKRKTAPTTKRKAPDTRPVSRPRNDKLTVNDINRVGTTKVKLTGVIRSWTNMRGGIGKVALIIEVIVAGPRGPHRDYFLSFGRPDMIAAMKQLGDDIGQWTGQVLEVEQDATGRYVNVYDHERQRDAAPRAASEPSGTSDDGIPF